MIHQKKGTQKLVWPIQVQRLQFLMAQLLWRSLAVLARHTLRGAYIYAHPAGISMQAKEPHSLPSHKF